MKTLFEVVSYIHNLKEPVPFVALPVDDWQKVREECRVWCEAHDEPFTMDPRMVTPNFLVHGMPVVEGGRA